jgi:hypothetical protein
MNRRDVIPDVLKTILRDFCHMEWYETHELRAWNADANLMPERRKLVEDFRAQLADAIARAYITPEQFEAITADDCKSEMEVVARLRRIEAEIFGRHDDT